MLDLFFSFQRFIRRTPNFLELFKYPSDLFINTLSIKHSPSFYPAANYAKFFKADVKPMAK
tara:strand:+ start:40 stop:222 length:183 start_codon:yes stop_codon:yes gene_type:complete